MKLKYFLKWANWKIVKRAVSNLLQEFGTTQYQLNLVERIVKKSTKPTIRITWIRNITWMPHRSISSGTRACNICAWSNTADTFRKVVLSARLGMLNNPDKNRCGWVWWGAVALSDQSGSRPIGLFSWSSDLSVCQPTCSATRWLAG